MKYLTALAAGAALLASVGLAGAAEIKIGIDNFTFNPKEVKVTAGDTVVWTNNDDIPHTVASPQHQIRSKPLDTGDTFSFTFTTPGEFKYFCSLHPHMTGRIVVEAATGENGAK